MENETKQNINEIYRHYKGGLYIVLMLAISENAGELQGTNALQVVYQNLDTKTIYVRPYSEFFGDVQIGNRQEMRFSKIAGMGELNNLKIHDRVLAENEIKRKFEAVQNKDKIKDNIKLFQDRIERNKIEITKMLERYEVSKENTINQNFVISKLIEFSKPGVLEDREAYLMRAELKAIWNKTAISSAEVLEDLYKLSIATREADIVECEKVIENLKDSYNMLNIN